MTVWQDWSAVFLISSVVESHLRRVSKGGNIDTLILEGERVADAIDHYHETGEQYDFFA